MQRYVPEAVEGSTTAAAQAPGPQVPQQAAGLIHPGGHARKTPGTSEKPRAASTLKGAPSTKRSGHFHIQKRLQAPF